MSTVTSSLMFRFLQGRNTSERTLKYSLPLFSQQTHDWQLGGVRYKSVVIPEHDLKRIQKIRKSVDYEQIRKLEAAFFDIKISERGFEDADEVAKGINLARAASGGNKSSKQAQKQDKQSLLDVNRPRYVKKLSEEEDKLLKQLKGQYNVKGLKKGMQIAMQFNGIIRARNRAIDALPEWARDEAEEFDMTPPPLNRWIATETPPIKGYNQSKFEEEYQEPEPKGEAKQIETESNQ